jgi:hypothetical protein
VFGSGILSVLALPCSLKDYILPLCRTIEMRVKKGAGRSVYGSVACVRRMVMFTSAPDVCDAQSAGVHDPPHVNCGTVSRGLVIGWQVRATWVRQEDRESKD